MDTMNYLTKSDLKQLVLGGKIQAKDVTCALASTLLRAVPPAENRAPLGPREVLFVATDTTIDREGDVIVSSGVDTRNFESEGFLLFGHNGTDPDYLMGYPTEIIKEESRILVRAEFFTEEENPKADRVFRMIKAARRSGASVGIRILEHTEATDRPGMMPWNILKSELVELSVTPVPMNPGAVAIALGCLEEKPTLELLTSIADEPAIAAVTHSISEQQVKALVFETVKELTGGRTYSVPKFADPARAALEYFARVAE